MPLADHIAHWLQMMQAANGPKQAPAPAQMAPEVAAAHARLFGQGALVSPAIASGTPDEQAMAARPRAANAGHDINLPAVLSGPSQPVVAANIAKLKQMGYSEEQATLLAIKQAKAGSQ